MTVYRSPIPDDMRLGSARASVVPLLGPTVRVGSENGEFYPTTMDSKNFEQPRGNKRRAEQALTLSDEDSDHITYPRFLVISANNTEPIKYSIFAIQKFLQCGVGEVKSAKKLRNGTVLIEVTSKTQSDRALAMTIWFDTCITVTPHRSLNTCRGVIRSRELRDCDDGEVLEALHSQGVTAVKRITTKRNGHVEPTNTIILTFNLPTPPKFVKAAYHRMDVEPYIPNPLRCYNCQKFGHGKNACTHRAVCARCNQEGHLDTDCQNTPHCANCSAEHPSYSRECPEWTKQKDITRIKFERNLPFRDAKQIYE